MPTGGCSTAAATGAGRCCGVDGGDGLTGGDGSGAGWTLRTATGGGATAAGVETLTTLGVGTAAGRGGMAVGDGGAGSAGTPVDG